VKDKAAAISLGEIHDAFDTMSEVIDVKDVFKETIQQGDNLIIPASEKVSVMGFGGGVGFDQDKENGSHKIGGGRKFSRSIAVVVASAEGVRVKPVFDSGAIALAAFTTGAFLLGFILRIFNPRKLLKDLSEGKF